MIRNLHDNERPALRRLTQSARSQPCPAPEGPLKEYDWKSPCSFTADQVQKLLAASGEIAAELSRCLGGLLKADATLHAGTVAQVYGADAAAAPKAAPKPDAASPAAGPAGVPAAEGVFCAELAGDDKRRCGWVELPGRTAGEWVARMLGGPASAKGQPGPRELSPLERSLLADLFTGAAGAIATVLRKLGAKPVRYQGAAAPGGDAVSGRPQLTPDEELQEFCRLTFAGEGSACCDVLLLSDWLAPLATGAASKAAALPPAEAKKHLLAHLSQASVEATAQLGVATVLVEDVVALEEGDVLVTGTRLGEEIVLEVQGRPILKAVPVFSDGSYALRVTEVIRPDSQKQTKGN